MSKNSARCSFPLAVAYLALATAPALWAETYESLPTLRAVDRLPVDLLKGPHHSVAPEVRSDGFMTYFTIESDYGVYKTASLEETTARIREVYAIADLEEMSRAAVAGKGVAEGVKQPFLAVKSVVTRPSETADRVGESLGRWVARGKLSLRNTGKKAGRAAEQAQEVYDDRRNQRRSRELAEQEVRDRAIAEGQDPEAAVAEYRQRPEEAAAENLAARSDAQRKQERIEWAGNELKKAAYRYLGYDKARRKLAQQLGVDPYTTNLELQERLDVMAWALWAGQFGSGYVLPSSVLVRRAQDVNQLVWTTHPKDLEVRNREQMKAMGVDTRLVDAFFDHPHYTTSDRTQMIVELAGLAGVSNRDHFFRLAVAADSPLLGSFFRRTARMLSRARRPLERLVVPTENIAIAMTDAGDLVLLLAVDHASWTESLDLLVSAVERHSRAAGFEGRIVLMLSGDVTPKARRGVEAFGWTVETWTLDQLAG